MADISKLRVGSSSPSLMLFGQRTDRILESKFDFTTWTKVDGAGDIDVTAHRVVIKKFKPNTMLMRSAAITGTPNTAICAACAGMKLSVSGIDANSAVFLGSQTLTNNHGAGSDLPKARGLCFYPGTTDGYLMMERMYTWEKCWSDAETRDLSSVADWPAFRHGSGHGQYGWRNDVTNEVNIPAELYDFPNWDRSAGNTSVTWCMMFGLYTNTSDDEDDTTSVKSLIGDDGLIDISANPITITEGVTAVDPCSVECWDVYHGDEQMYHKDKTYANCWKKYGFESKQDDVLDNSAKIYRITSDNYPEADEIYVPPITDLGTGSGLALYPYTEVDGVLHVRSFNIAPYNKDFWTAIKDWYASHEIEAKLLSYDLPTDDDGVAPYSLFENCGIDELTLNLTTKDTKADGFKYYGYTNVPFQNSKIEKLTLNGDIRYTSMCNFFKGAKQLAELAWNLPSAGAVDCRGLFAYGNKMTTYPTNMIDWSYRMNGSRKCTPMAYAFDYHSCIVTIPQYSGASEREDDTNTIISDISMQQFLNGCDSLTAIMPVLDLRYVVPTGMNVYNALLAPSLSDARIKNLNNGDWHLDGSKYDATNGYVTGNLKSLDAESIAYLFDNLVDLPASYKEDNVNTPSTCFINDETDYEDFSKEAWVDKTRSIGETLYPYSVSRDNVRMSIRHAANTVVNGVPSFPHIWTYAAFSMDVKVTGMQANDKLYIGSTEITADGTYTVSNEQGTACYIALVDTSLEDDATSTDTTNVVQVTIVDAYDPSKSVVSAASLYCPAEWEETYDAVSGNDFDTLVLSANGKGWTVFVGGTERVVYDANTTNAVKKKDNVDVTIVNKTVNDTLCTSCLPFTLTADMATEVFGDGTKIMKFTSFDGKIIRSSDAELVEAGVPFLIQGATKMVNPTFRGVNITVTEPQTVTHGNCTFRGTFSFIKQTLTSEEGVEYWGYSQGEFTLATKSFTLKGFAAFYEIVSEESTET